MVDIGRAILATALWSCVVGCASGRTVPPSSPGSAPFEPAVPGLPSPPADVLAASRGVVLPLGFLRTEEGRTFCVKDGMEMVLVPAGDFTMGSEQGSIGGNSIGGDEMPMHRVYVSAYLVDRHEVTVGQFRRFCAANPGMELPEQRTGSTDVHPVVNVDWNGAAAYADWAGRRLPTEAEWEKAARGTDGRTYPWGNLYDEGKRSGQGSADGFEGLAPVGSFPGGASPCGALDMAGNVGEWCADWHDDNFYRSPEARARDPRGPVSGSFRVLRGGAWNGYQIYLRAAFRHRTVPSLRNEYIGIRAARSLP